MNNKKYSYNMQDLLSKELYQQLVSVLEYKNNPFYRRDESGDYDAIYYANVEQNEYPLVGIKCFENLDETVIIKHHLLYWNRNDIPISVMVFPEEIRVYNNFTQNRKKALLCNSKNEKQYTAMINDLKASKITTKIVWERLEKLSTSKDRVDKQLLSNIRNTVLYANREHGMMLEDAYNFMSLCIFVKYLEDRKMLKPSVFLKWGANSFTDLLENVSIEGLGEFFKLLKERFNGDLFVVSDKNLPSNEQLAVFYKFFRGDDIYTDGDSQLTLFPYDFSVIPIELISNIYETFLSADDEVKKEKKAAQTGTFYTPYYLADYIVQKSFMPYKRDKKIPCILDPACGSGVFLVDSYKNQVQILKEKCQVLETRDLCNLLENNIFGIDLNLNALKISCFSLYIALLDELTPKDIMENTFRFPCLLGKNLIEGSFFSEKVDSSFKDKKFNLILGNPPWKSIPNSDHVFYCKRKNIPIADAQIAQAFLCRAKDFADDKTQVLFLQTNSIFTNKKSKAFLRYFLEEYCVENIINLESIKGQLFSHAKYPCSIVGYRCVKKNNYSIRYQAFRLNGLFTLLRKFVCDKNEIVYISKKKLINREFIWTVLTYGDEFDVDCIETMLKFPPLSKLIKGKLDFVQGYITASDGKKNMEFAKYRGGSLTNTFLPYGIDFDNTPMISEEILYDREIPLEIYTCPHKLLVKRTYNENCWGAAYVQEPLIFCNDFSTFNDYSGENVSLLKYLEGAINSAVFRYYGFYMSKIKAAKKPEMVKEDVLRFPLPVYDESNMEIRQIIDLVSQMEQKVHEEWKLKSRSPWITGIEDMCILQRKLDECFFKLYRFDDFQVSVIKEGIERFNKSGQILYAEKGDYQKYAEYICDYFNYFMKKSLNSLWKAKIDEGDFYTAIFFSFNREEILIDPNILGLSGLEEISGQLLVQRRVVTFVNDGFCIIQSTEKSNWTLGKAKKMAIKLTQEIMNVGGNIYE